MSGLSINTNWGSLHPRIRGIARDMVSRLNYRHNAVEGNVSARYIFRECHVCPTRFYDSHLRIYYDSYWECPQAYGLGFELRFVETGRDWSLHEHHDWSDLHRYLEGHKYMQIPNEMRPAYVEFLFAEDVIRVLNQERLE